MNGGKSTVITVYGHNRTIDKIAVSLFDKSEAGYYGYDKDAKIYCDTINSLKLEGESWVFAKIVSENTQYSTGAFFPLRFDILLTLDDRAIQKILREVEGPHIAKALKGASEAIQEKIFKNMSKRAAQMLKEDMEYMGPIRMIDVKEGQDKVLDIIRQLEQAGEIVILYKGDIIE
jgi:flagellar motor switch protein FliG